MKLQSLKPLQETKYLSTENAWRYRAIMRIFYMNDQKFRHWLTKEDIYEQIKEEERFGAYTMDMCRQDLEVLRDWGNLSAVQDTSRVTTYEQFVNKQFRSMPETGQSLQKVLVLSSMGVICRLRPMAFMVKMK